VHLWLVVASWLPNEDIVRFRCGSEELIYAFAHIL